MLIFITTRGDVIILMNTCALFMGMPFREVVAGDCKWTILPSLVTICLIDMLTSVFRELKDTLLQILVSSANVFTTQLSLTDGGNGDIFTIFFILLD